MSVHPLTRDLNEARHNAAVIIQNATGADYYQAGVARDLISLVILNNEGFARAVGVGLVILMIIGENDDREWAPNVNEIIAAVAKCDNILNDFPDDF